MHIPWSAPERAAAGAAVRAALAVNERRIDLAELRLSALIGPVTAGAFLIVFTSRSVYPQRHGRVASALLADRFALLLLEWELTRRLILGLSRLSYR